MTIHIEEVSYTTLYPERGYRTFKGKINTLRARSSIKYAGLFVRAHGYDSVTINFGGDNENNYGTQIVSRDDLREFAELFMELAEVI